MGNRDVLTPWSSPSFLSHLPCYYRWFSEHFIHISILGIHTLILMAHLGCLLIVFIRKAFPCVWPVSTWRKNFSICLSPFPTLSGDSICHCSRERELCSACCLFLKVISIPYTVPPWSIPFSFLSSPAEVENIKESNNPHWGCVSWGHKISAHDNWTFRKLSSECILLLDGDPWFPKAIKLCWSA